MKNILCFSFIIICFFFYPNTAEPAIALKGERTPPKHLELNNPSNQSTDHIPNDFFSFNWLPASGLSGDTVFYDLYLGESSNPGLFKENLFDGWVSPNGMEFSYMINSGTDDILFEFFAYPHFLLPNKKYYWKVIAKGSLGEQLTSEVFSFTTTRNNLLPSQTQLIEPSNNAVDVSKTPTFKWEPSIDPDGDEVSYNLYVQSPRGPFLKVSGLKNTSYKFLEPLKDQQRYYWWVEAVDGFSGQVVGQQGTYFTVENYEADPPVAGLLTSPPNGRTNNTFDVSFEWNVAIDKDQSMLTYDVYAGIDTDNQELLAENLSTPSYRHLFSDYGQHYWKVVVKDDTGLSDTSQVFSFTTWNVAPDFQIDMAFVAGGTFTMGQSDSSKFFEFYSSNGTPIYYNATNENPGHEVSVNNFFISKYEITNQQYVAFLNAIKDEIDIVPSMRAHRRLSFPYRNVTFRGKELCQVFDATQTTRTVPYEETYDSPIIWDGTSFSLDPTFVDHPARFMFYDGAAMFAKWAGKDFRLPREAEWEYAALGGQKGRGYKFSGSNELDEVAVHGIGNPIDQPEYTKPVGSLRPNELGIYDMTGNVQEICEDFYSSVYYKNSPKDNPVNQVRSGGFGHICRGGVYTYAWEALYRVKRRTYLAGSQYINMSGFRLVADFERPYYMVSGSIHDAKGNPVSGAKIKGLEQEIQTDVSGSFSVLLPEGWSGTMVPEFAGKEFDPAEYFINDLQKDNNNLNFTATDIAIADYSISGVVRDQNGNPLSGVVLVGFNDEVMTDEKGKFYAEVPSGWTETVRPVLLNYVFSPVERGYTMVNEVQTLQNFTATYTGQYVISGKILDFAGKPIVSTVLKGFPNATTTDGSGYYLSEVPAGWTGIIAPEKDGFHFSPTELTFSNVRKNFSEQNFLSDLINGIEEEQNGLNIFPNPSNGRVEIRPVLSIRSSGKVNIFNLQGQLIRILHLKAGTKGTTWEGRDSKGNSVPAGIYLCQVFVDEKVVDKVKIVIMK